MQLAAYATIVVWERLIGRQLLVELSKYHDLTVANEQQAYLAWKTWESSAFGEYSPKDSIYYTAEIARTRAKFATSSSVLEIGFGNGAFLAWGRDQGWSMEGTEIISSLLEQAKSQSYDVYTPNEFFASGRRGYDLIVAFDVLEHIPPSAAEEFFISTYSCLSSDAFLILRFPNADSPFGLEAQHGDPTHLNPIGIGKIKYYATCAGYKIIYLGPEAQPLFSGSLGLSLRRLITLPIKVVYDALIRTVFLPGSGVSMSARNTVAVLQKPSCA